MIIIMQHTITRISSIKFFSDKSNKYREMTRQLKINNILPSGAQTNIFPQIGKAGGPGSLSAGCFRSFAMQSAISVKRLRMINILPIN